ncbi:uncharacterized oxidoreductase YjmC isoform X4 [Cherax quadricarinatus]|uniref:uncharacterized oxidoreductase YjmC isoform X4 n=1 Tax=Cherax quadricarinatus TaxID=27406 RepID=UPI0023784E08|nr:uncharacterized oxidoreductase YjmC-like isoform X4 [Cherax quadricarinatus]
MASASEKSDNFTPNNLGIKYREEEVERFMVECMMTQGVSRDRATTLAQVLVAADVRGHYSHGLHRLGHYINDVKNNLCDAGTTPTIVKESVSTALVDGNNGLGPVVGKFAMDLAIRKAQTTGIGWVCAKGSNHYGIAGWYTMRAAKQGLVGVSFTNTHPVVVPTRGKQGALGTNPISVAAPAEGDDSFVLDMSTSVVAYGGGCTYEERSHPRRLGCRQTRLHDDQLSRVLRRRLHHASGRTGVALWLQGLWPFHDGRNILRNYVRGISLLTCPTSSWETVPGRVTQDDSTSMARSTSALHDVRCGKSSTTSSSGV